MENFEKSFDDFIDRKEYDQAENALFSMVKIAFEAGWLAAGGNPPRPQKAIEIRQKKVDVIPIKQKINCKFDK